MMAVILLFLAFVVAVSGKRLCENEQVQLDFGPKESFIASFTGGGGVETSALFNTPVLVRTLLPPPRTNGQESCERVGPKK